MPYQQKRSVKNRMMVSCFGCNAAFSQLTQQWLRFFSPFFCRVLAGSWSQRSGSKGTSCYFAKTKQAVTFSPEAMQAQEGQWDFAQKGRGHDWTCCRPLHHLCCAHTYVGVCLVFFSGFVRTQVWIHADPSWIPTDLFSAVGNMGWPIRDLGCLWEVFFWLHIAAAPQMPRQWQPIF